METITSKFENGLLTIFACGRIDTNNAAETEKSIHAACDANPTDNVVLDVENLEYISSAGLRVVLRLKKMKPALKVINAGTEIYEIFEMTGFSEMMTVEKAYRRLSVDGCEVIGRGAKGTVYRYDPDTVVKVYIDADSLPDIHRERELARKAFVLGIPTAISYDVVKVGESYGSVFELLDAKSYSKLIANDPENIEKYVRDYAELLRLIHSTRVSPSDMPDVKESMAKRVSTAAKYLSADDTAKLKALIDAVPDTMNMLHCDYHTNNIMRQNGETLLIDMDTLSHGHPVFELSNVWATYVGFSIIDSSNVESFLRMSSAQAADVWKYFLPFYLNSDDKDYIAGVEEKVELLGYLRLLRHTVHRWADKPFAEDSIKMCAAKISEYLNKIDSLEF